MIGRDAAIEAMAGKHFEVLVIGGGVTGAGVALDAASRGYSVALVEARDYASGTSSRSSKMVHGGLRYLQSFDLGLVREALLERQLLVKLAPHLVYPTPFLVPSVAENRLDRKLGVGLNMYDVMASRRGRRKKERHAEAGDGADWSPERHRTVSAEEAAEMAPALAMRDSAPAYLFYDCQTDDSRLVLTILGEANRLGAVSCNWCSVIGVDDHLDRPATVRVTEAESGEGFSVTADNVVNATGVWADSIRPGEIQSDEDVPRISPSRGTHLTLQHEALPLTDAACIIPAGEDRSILLLPWYGRTLVGTTDNDYDGPLDRVPVPDSDIEYLLDAVNGFFGASIGAEDITGAFAGVRPLISSADPRKSVDISRKAELYETSSGMLTITGGKLTTWRRMAKLAVDRLVEREGRIAPCVTGEIPLGMPARESDFEDGPPWDPDTREQLAFRYGHASSRITEIARDAPELAEPLVSGAPDVRAEAVQAARREQVRTLEDFLLRRTRLGLIAAPSLRDRRTLDSIAEILARELGWAKSRRRAEVDGWTDSVAAERMDPGANSSLAPLGGR